MPLKVNGAISATMINYLLIGATDPIGSAEEDRE